MISSRTLVLSMVLVCVVGSVALFLFAPVVPIDQKYDYTDNGVTLKVASTGSYSFSLTGCGMVVFTSTESFEHYTITQQNSYHWFC